MRSFDGRLKKIEARVNHGSGALILIPKGTTNPQSVAEAFWANHPQYIRCEVWPIPFSGIKKPQFCGLGTLEEFANILKNKMAVKNAKKRS